MLNEIISIIAPVFLVVLTGYLAVSAKLFTDTMVDALMRFAIGFAIPSLLFKATATMDLATAFDWRVMLAFFSGAAISFAVASYAIKKLFKRTGGESVAIGFAALFSNIILIGLPISERAWGAENMAPLFAIASVHAPFCYLLGISTMEAIRANGRNPLDTLGVIIKAMFRNSLMIGISLGFVFNFSGLALPNPVWEAVDLMSSAALPAALFALGGVLTRYKLSDAIGEISLLSCLSLIIHPLLVLLFATLLGLDGVLRASIVLIAAMGSGLNSYLFATMYQRGQGTAASTVLLATTLSVLTISIWLWVLR